MRSFAMTTAAALAALGLVLAMPVAATAATTNYTVDCQTLPYSSQYFYVVPGDTVTLNLTGFDEAYDNVASNGNVISTGGASVVLAAGDDVTFRDTNNICTASFTAYVYDAAPETVPSGSLLFTQNIALTAPSELTVTDNSGIGDHNFGGNPDCAVSANDHGIHVYQTLDITVLTSGTFTFRGMYSTPAGYYVGLNEYNPIGDPFLAVYSAFDPTNPDTGLVGCNDDANDVGLSNDAEYLSDGTIIEGHQPYFTAAFTPGDYTLVLLTYPDLSASDFASGYSPYDGENFTVGPMSTTFQLWGPAGGLALGSGSGSASAAALPPTGVDATSGAAGGILLLGGLVALGWSRRRRARRA